MPFKFQWLCELLEELQSNSHRRKTTNARAINPEHTIIKQWFNRYDNKIQRTGPSAIAFLSCLLPERRVDRVYNLQERRLSSIFGRALGLGHSRIQELNAWNTRDGDDFPTCLERVMAQCEFDHPPSGKEVTLEEIDVVLHQIAANSPFSSPIVRSSACERTPGELLTPILRRLQSKEAKWLVRMMLKSYNPVQLPDWFILHQFHFLLPDLLTIQNSFDAAIKTLAKATICTLPARPDKQYEAALRPLMAREIVPELGVMIRRQPYHKARSIKHSCGIAAQGLMSVERKYDGEYCQIHVNLRKGTNCMQIFSKSGKDSTSDRLRLHGAIKDALRIDRNGCNFREKCVVEGELLVWSSTTKEILPFHKIRKHVKHAGRYLGTANDSPVNADESLMIILYDLLLLDDKLLLNEPHTVRRQHLKGLIHNIPGRCIIGERIMIDFSSGQASKKLREHFAYSISQRWEGLVLKPSDAPFFNFRNANHGIKMKKDYMVGLGDSADLCLVGGRRDPKVELELRLGALRWTSFCVGCLMNKYDVQRFSSKPRIKIIDELTSHSMPNVQLLELNTIGRLFEVPYSTSIAQYDVELGHAGTKKPSELFYEPFIVEIMGAGFERLSNAPYYTLRFPRKIDGRIKLHSDRTLIDTTNFDELQEMAKKSMKTAQENASREDAEWIKKLLRVEGRSQSTQNKSQLTTPGRSPKSPGMIELPIVRTYKRPSTNVIIRADSEEPALYATQASKSSVSIGIPTYPPSALKELSPLCGQLASKKRNSTSSAASTQANNKRRCVTEQKLTISSNTRLELQNGYTLPNAATVYSPSLILDTAPSMQARFIHTSEDITCEKALDLIAPRRSTRAADYATEMEQQAPGRLITSEQPVDDGAVESVSHSTEMSTNTSYHTAPSKLPRESGTTERNGNISAMSFLPTPPTSSSEEVTRLVGEETLSKTTEIPDSLPILQTHSEQKETGNEPASEVQMPIESGNFKIVAQHPIFIADSVKSSSRRDNLLRQTNTSYTFSIDNFLHQVAGVVPSERENPNSLHIVLVDFCDFDGTRQDVLELFHWFKFRANAHLKIRNGRLHEAQVALRHYSNRVLVFDYNLLGYYKSERIDLNSMMKLRNDGKLDELFGGVCKLDEERLTKHQSPKYRLETDWSWLPDGGTGK